MFDEFTKLAEEVGPIVSETQKSRRMRRFLTTFAITHLQLYTTFE